LACLLLSLPFEPRAGTLLRLREAEHAQPVRVTRIIGSPERPVMLTAILTPKTGNPGAALGAFPIPKCAANRKHRPIGLTTRGQFHPSRSRVDFWIANRACHPSPGSKFPDVRKLYGTDVAKQEQIGTEDEFSKISKLHIREHPPLYVRALNCPSFTAATPVRIRLGTPMITNA